MNEFVNNNTNNQLKEDRESLDSINSFNQNQPLSSRDTGISSIRNSKESKESLNSCGNSNSFLGDKIKPEMNNVSLKDDSNNLQLQIKDSLKKMSEQYSMNQYESHNSLFNYYCTPFLYHNNNKKDYYYANKFKEYNNNFNRNCPFELCKDH